MSRSPHALDATPERLRHAPGSGSHPTEVAGVSAVRVLTVVETLMPTRRGVETMAARGQISIIHVSAAHKLLDIAETAAGARQPPSEIRGATADFGRLDIQHAAIRQMGRLARVIAAAGPLCWPVVRGVVIDGRTVTMMAGADSTRARRPWMAALREGLEAAARDFGMMS